MKGSAARVDDGAYSMGLLSIMGLLSEIRHLSFN